MGVAVLHAERLVRVLVAELEVPEAAMHPEVAKALDSYQEAQARFGLGDYRGAAVSIRH